MSDSAIDRAVIQRLVTTLGDEGASLVIDVIETFLDEAPKLLADLREAMATEQAAGVRDTAHSLKSCAAALGATRLSEACATLETAAGTYDMVTAVKLVSEVEAEHMAARLALYETVAGLRCPVKPAARWSSPDRRARQTL